MVWDTIDVPLKDMDPTTVHAVDLVRADAGDGDDDEVLSGDAFHILSFCIAWRT